MTAEQPVDPFLPLEEALQHLIDGFDQIEALPLETGGSDPVADERAKTMLELVAVGYFMKEVEVLKGRGRRLVKLLAALNDVHQGLNPEMFKKPEAKSKQGRPKPEFSVQHHRARAAAALEFCIRADPAPRPNVTEIAQRVANGCARWFDDRPTANQIKLWRTDFKAGGNDDGAQYYKVTIASLEDQFPDPEQAAQAALYLLST